MKKLLLILLLVFSLQTVSGVIVESGRFSDLLDYLKEDTWVILDIDNTLIEPIQTLGSDQWFRYRIKWYKEQGYDDHNSLLKALDEWQAVQFITKVKLVENETPQVIRSLQDEGRSVMGLTSRGLALATRTVEQLASVNIDLSRATFSDRDLLFFNPRGILYRKGVLFCAGTHKGEAFHKMLDLSQVKPNSVLFIDDRPSDLKSVEEVCEREGIEFIGLRYGFVDQKVEDFDYRVTNIQFDQMVNIISDEAAKRILNSNK
ncbi:MAG: DUF2608 domain-containing protein [Waddliaceae bacterium]